MGVKGGMKPVPVLPQSAGNERIKLEQLEETDPAQKKVNEDRHYIRRSEKQMQRFIQEKGVDSSATLTNATHWV